MLFKAFVFSNETGRRQRRVFLRTCLGHQGAAQAGRPQLQKQPRAVRGPAPDRECRSQRPRSVPGAGRPGAGRVQTAGDRWSLVEEILTWRHVFRVSCLFGSSTRGSAVSGTPAQTTDGTFWPRCSPACGRPGCSPPRYPRAGRLCPSREATQGHWTQDDSSSASKSRTCGPA